MNTCSFMADVADEVNSVCDEEMLARKINDVLILLDGMHDWEHQKEIIHLTAGNYDKSNLLQIVDSDRCKQTLMRKLTDCHYVPKRCIGEQWGNILVVPYDCYYAVRKRAKIDWTDCSKQLPFDDGFLAALRYGAIFMLESGAKKTQNMLIANQIFQQLLASAQDASAKVVPIQGMPLC